MFRFESMRNRKACFEKSLWKDKNISDSESVSPSDEFSGSSSAVPLKILKVDFAVRFSPSASSSLDMKLIFRKVIPAMTTASFIHTDFFASFICCNNTAFFRICLHICRSKYQQVKL